MKRIRVFIEKITIWTFDSSVFSECSVSRTLLDAKSTIKSSLLSFFSFISGRGLTRGSVHRQHICIYFWTLQTYSGQLIAEAVNRERSVVSWITAIRIHPRYWERGATATQYNHTLPASVWDRELDRFISSIFLLSQSVPVPDEGVIYLKWLITARDLKRLDENPILSHIHQTDIGLP